MKLKQMPKIWEQELTNLCFVQSHSYNEKRMVLYLDNWLYKHKLDYTIDDIGNIIVTKGKAATYPCIVSHMDTVHHFVDDYKIFDDKKRNLFAKDGKKATGIGGDDKCGIFACLYFLDKLPVAKVVFFTQEESGCKGSDKIDKLFFDDCRYIIQLDRRGKKDFIDTKFREKTVSHGFSSEIGHIKKEFKFKSTEGSITDCINLWSDGVGISCVNISSGYYNSHMKTEYIAIDELWNSILFTKEVIKTLKPKRYISVKKPITITNSNYGYSYKRQKIWCTKCQTMQLKSIGKYVNNKFVCYDCCKTDTSVIKYKYGHCRSCFKTVDPGDLQWNSDLACMACSACRAVINETKPTSNTMVCDACMKLTPTEQGRTGIESFICDDCYTTTKNDNVSTILETCSVCNEEKSKTMGKYDGEIFICENCKETYDTKVATELCDDCQELIPITRGLYGDGGATFVCGECIMKK